MPPWLRTALIGACLFMLGGALSFGYSYRPLHGALTWKVDELEERIDANASARTWRKRYESLRDRTAAAAAKPAAQPVAPHSNPEASIKADPPAALLNSSLAPSELSSRSPEGEEQGILSSTPAPDTSRAQP